MTWDQVAAFRLSRHHLLERAPAKALIRVARDMAGAQAQLHSAAQISLWSRIGGLRRTQVEKALDERRLVKASCMRCTLFLIPAADLPVFALGAAERGRREVQWALGKGVPGRTVDAAIDAALGVLEQPLTRPEIAERVSRALGVRRQDIHGGGWGRQGTVAAVPVGELVFPIVDLLQLVATRGVVCYGPNRGGEPTFVRADAWLPGWRALPTEEAEALFMRRYLRSYGPATSRDFSMWSGFTFAKAGAIWAREQARLAPVVIEGRDAAVLREDLDELAGARFERPTLRLLPYFDTFILGHREREHLADAKHLPRIYRAQGWIAPVVLVDGRAAAVWGYAREGDRLHVTVEKLRPLSRHIVAGIRAEAQDLGRFLEIPDVDVRLV